MSATGTTTPNQQAPLTKLGKYAVQVAYYYWVVILFGYIFLNKGFAYLGLPPLYVGEIGLLLAALSAAVIIRQGQAQWSRFGQAAILMLFLFLIWQVARTLPFLTTYGLNTIRDAMLWGYSAYAIFICIVFTHEQIDEFSSIYGRVLPFLLVWLPVIFILTRLFHLRVSLPGLAVPLLLVRTGDMGVHLAGLGAFLLLGLYSYGRKSPKLALLGLWALWWLAFIAYGSVNRAGMLSASLVILVILFRPRSNWMPALLAGLVVIAFFQFSGIQVKVVQENKKVEVSPRQIYLNYASMVATLRGEKESDSDFEPEQGGLRISTIAWRLRWWETIVGYTFEGPYLWTGKGYGINLADSDGFQGRMGNLRSPHNATMNILARSGLPGLLLWLAFLASMAFQMIRIIVSPRYRLSHRTLLLWMGVYWLAFLCNSTFGVFFEAPMGGIWFWSLNGLILATMADARLTGAALEEPESGRSLSTSAPE
jgi:O-antigen ligase/polysaccharide polymerase Wzy-like membrane protein